MQNLALLCTHMHPFWKWVPLSTFWKCTPECFWKKHMLKKLALKLPKVSKDVIYTPKGDTQSAGSIFLQKRRVFLIIGLYSKWHKFLYEMHIVTKISQITLQSHKSFHHPMAGCQSVEAYFHSWHLLIHLLWKNEIDISIPMDNQNVKQDQTSHPSLRQCHSISLFVKKVGSVG